MILVCGDSMIDRYWFGEVNRISPEAPVPVIKMKREEEREGAAANVAANCVCMGSKVVRLFSPSPDQILKIRVIGKNQQVVRVDFDHPQEPIDVEKFESIVKSCAITILSDYGKGALSNIDTLIPIAKKYGSMVLVDPKSYDFKRYAGADIVKPNTDEMIEMIGGWGDEKELAWKVEQLRKDSGIKSILLTRASEGMTLFTENGSTHIPSIAKEVFDVSGAGDTAIAALAVALEKGMDLVDAAEYANKAAGISVGHFGTVTVSEQEVFS